MDTEALREAFDASRFEMVQTAPTGEIPTATPAAFAFDEPLEGPASEVQAAIDGHDDAFIDGDTEVDPDSESYVRTKVYDDETNEFLKTESHTDSLRIVPADEGFSFETFRRFV
ncbi:hypothetical protein [Halopiger goleimassiliensis]|uniref:hypothetical protein n=1 Tax=Halopiger goleimassiliensis TaxID=1293048 RepID=UPI000677EA57|nr:hypothetical protein [Halopiger goleimassiliensis]